MLVLAGYKLRTRASAGGEVGQPTSRWKDYTPLRECRQEARYMRICSARALCCLRNAGICALRVRFAAVVMQEYVLCVCVLLPSWCRNVCSACAFCCRSDAEIC